MKAETALVRSSNASVLRFSDEFRAEMLVERQSNGRVSLTALRRR